MKRIYVGNLSFSWGEEEVRELFSAYGEVFRVDLINDRATGRPRGFGFVEMDASSADAAIDALEEQLNEEIARIIALRQPTAVDLRIVLTVLKMSSNLERIGDYAKNMAKRSTVLANMGQISGAAASIRRMAKEVERMLKDVLAAYIQRDPDMAHEVILRDEDLDQMYNALFREFLTFMMEDPRNITACTHLLFCAKNLERIGDHVTNIAEQVIYMVTGEQPDEKRPKGDTTSLNTSITQG